MDRLIFVLGTPSGGTSAVAGMLSRLGVDMGQSIRSRRPYAIFEDRRVRDYACPAPEGDVTRQIIPSQRDTWRDFRAYCEMRLREAHGRPCGVKIGSTAWLGDPDPGSLPIRIVRVRRPLEHSIRSNWKYGKEQGQKAIRRAMQVTGYWACCEELCRIAPHLHVHTIDFYALLETPAIHVAGLVHALELEPEREQMRKAAAFIDGRMRNV